MHAYGSSIAFSSLANNQVKGKTVEGGCIKNIGIARKPSLSPLKLHFFILTENATKALKQEEPKTPRKER